jgi:hypothetical protein
MDIMIEDFLRFSKLHSWYKHIPLEGDIFVAYLKKGQEIRHPIDPQVIDSSNNHWHFSLVDNYKSNGKSFDMVIFTPFLYGLDGIHNKYAGTFNIILDKNKDTFMEWIKKNYKEYEHISLDEWKIMDYKDPILIKIYEKEFRKNWYNFVNATCDKKYIGSNKYFNLLCSIYK